MKKLNSKAEKVAFIVTMMVLMFVLVCTNLTEVIGDRVENNWFLAPIELYGVEENPDLAQMYVPDEYQGISIHDDEYGGWKTFDWLEDINSNQELWDYAKANPGTLRFFNWHWNSAELKEKYLPIYGEGLWAIKAPSN